MNKTNARTEILCVSIRKKGDFDHDQRSIEGQT